ncbi:MAG: spore coat protein CotJB [Candidatus Limousia pullorum]
MTERQILMKKLSTYAFAAYDLHLFLDTHPNDRETAAKLVRYKEKLRPLVEEYESKFGPLTADEKNGNRWCWIQSPWPWEIEEGK